MPKLDKGSFGVVKLCTLRGEGRKGFEGWLKNEVRMKHIIYTVDYIEFSFCWQIIQFKITLTLWNCYFHNISIAVLDFSLSLLI